MAKNGIEQEELFFGVSHFSRQYKYSDRVREGYRIKGSSADLKFPPFRRLTSWPRFLAVKLDGGMAVVCRCQWWRSYHHHYHHHHHHHRYVSTKLCSIMVKRRADAGNEGESERTKGSEALFSAPFVNVATHASFQNITIMVKSDPFNTVLLIFIRAFLPLNSSRNLNCGIPSIHKEAEIPIVLEAIFILNRFLTFLCLRAQIFDVYKYSLHQYALMYFFFL